MGFLDDVRKAMQEHQAKTGKRYMQMDHLAGVLGIQAESNKRERNGQLGMKLGGEVLEDKLRRVMASADDLGVDFPWEIINYRERESAGLGDVPKQDPYKSAPIIDPNTGTIKRTAGGKESMQNYYWPFLVWRDEDKAKDYKSASDFLGMLRTWLESQGMSANDGFMTTVEGSQVIIDFQQHRLARERARIADEAAKGKLSVVA